MDAHSFTDDTQLYLSFKQENTTDKAEAVCAMERCIGDLRKCMHQDKSKINDEKIEFLNIGSRRQLLKINPCTVCVGTTDTKPVSEVRNLGSWFDSNFSMSTNITKPCSVVLFWLHNIKLISVFFFFFV